MRKIFILSTCAFFLFSCSLLSPKAKIEINLVGEKTSLENQVIGNYDFIGNDELLLVSIRTMPDDISLISDGRKRAFLAYQNRKYNEDDYRRFMDMGIIGESWNGRVAVTDSERLARDSELHRFVRRFIEEENRDREIIFQRILSVTEGLSSTDMEKVREIFAKKFREEAEKGWLIEISKGDWQKK